MMDDAHRARIDRRDEPCNAAYAALCQSSFELNKRQTLTLAQSRKQAMLRLEDCLKSDLGLLGRMQTIFADTREHFTTMLRWGSEVMLVKPLSESSNSSSFGTAQVSVCNRLLPRSKAGVP